VLKCTLQKVKEQKSLEVDKKKEKIGAKAG
jgi:hypothetical protein